MLILWISKQKVFEKRFQKSLFFSICSKIISNDRRTKTIRSKGTTRGGGVPYPNPNNFEYFKITILKKIREVVTSQSYSLNWKRGLYQALLLLLRFKFRGNSSKNLIQYWAPRLRSNCVEKLINYKIGGAMIGKYTKFPIQLSSIERSIYGLRNY